MAKSKRTIKFDVSDVDPNENRPQRELPKPAVYTCEIKSAELVDKRSGEGQHIKVEYRIIEGKHKGFPSYDYVDPSNPNVKWKLDQFLQAVGITKRKGELDLDAVVGTKVAVRLAADSYRQDDGSVVATLKAKAVMPLEDDEDDDDEEVDVDEDDYDEDDDEDDEEEEAPTPAKKKGAAKPAPVKSKRRPVEDDDEDEDDEDEDDEPAPKKKASPAAKAKSKKAPEPEPEEDDEDGVPDYEEWSLDELQAEIETRELTAPRKVTKATLIRVLRKDDDENPLEG